MTPINFIDVTNKVIDELNSIPNFDLLSRGICQNDKSNRAGVVQEYISTLKRKLTLQDILNRSSKLLESWNTEESLKQTYIQTNDFGFEPSNLNRFDPKIKENIEIKIFNSIKPLFTELVIQRQDSVNNHPQLFSISIPNAFLESKAELKYLPISIYFHTPLSNGIGAGNYIGDTCLKSNSDRKFYPFGWDFLFYILLQNKILLTNALSLAKKDEIVIIPILNQEPIKNKNGVVIDEVALGEMTNPKHLISIMESISHFLFKRFERKIFIMPHKYSLYAFSGGNVSLLKLLSHINDFKSVLKKVTFFDPPENDRTDLVNFIKTYTSKGNYANLTIQLYIKRTTSIDKWLADKILIDKFITFGESESLKIGLINNFSAFPKITDNGKHWKVRDLSIYNAVQS